MYANKGGVGSVGASRRGGFCRYPRYADTPRAHAAVDLGSNAFAVAHFWTAALHRNAAARTHALAQSYALSGAASRRIFNAASCHDPAACGVRLALAVNLYGPEMPPLTAHAMRQSRPGKNTEGTQDPRLYDRTRSNARHGTGRVSTPDRSTVVSMPEARSAVDRERRGEQWRPERRRELWRQ